MTLTQRETLHDLFVTVAKTDAATPAQRARASELARRMEWAELLRNAFEQPGSGGLGSIFA